MKKKKDTELEDSLKKLKEIAKEMARKKRRERFFICEDCLKKLALRGSSFFAFSKGFL